MCFFKKFVDVYYIFLFEWWRFFFVSSIFNRMLQKNPLSCNSLAVYNVSWYHSSIITTVKTRNERQHFKLSKPFKITGQNLKKKIKWKEKTILRAKPSENKWWISIFFSNNSLKFSFSKTLGRIFERCTAIIYKSIFWIGLLKCDQTLV